ncbi:MAG TPA: amidohydrolase family protein [Patescibacteria group bacterium]|nr:amidohydrolase family protein [Patescibacteria group bacterium]
MFDLLIKNGTVIDGSGAPMKRADVAVHDDVIVTVGDVGHSSARRTIDAEGCYVTPGFIDVTNHADTYWRLFATPTMESALHQGITTIIGGSCGSSLAPLTGKDALRSIQKWTDVQSVNINWLTMEEFFSAMKRQRLSANFGTLVGHNTLRRFFVGDTQRPLNQKESDAVAKMLDRALHEGALGLSTGLVYSHARSASEQELMTLARVVRKHGCVYATHVRDEMRDLVISIEEAIRIAQKSGVRLHIAHLKAVGSENWHLMDDALSMIETAHMSDLPVTFDVYPYTVTGSVLYVFLPLWVSEGGKTMMKERLKNAEIRSRVAKEMRQNSPDLADAIISISSLGKTLTRRRIGEIAHAQGKSVPDTVMDLLVAGDGRMIVMVEAVSERNIAKAIRNPFALIASNGAAYTVAHADSGETVHPRSFGAFPRALARYVVRDHIVSWEEAIHKMSGKSAAQFGISDRGLVQEGYKADVVVIDPKKIMDCATIEQPYHYAKGIPWVTVNGVVVVENGTHNGARPGQIVRH